MIRVIRFPAALRRDPAVDAWFEARSDELGRIARRWFAVMRDCGNDVRELLHDGQPTACVGDAAFAYVDAFTAHVNVGFFGGNALADPSGLLGGNGKYMRHVTLTPQREIDPEALSRLIRTAYADMRERVADVKGNLRRPD